MTPALVTSCRGHAPWTPWYTCLIPVLVDRFYLRAQHSLMLSCAFMQGACPLHWYTSLIPVLVCMFNPSSAIHFLSQFCYTCFIWIVKVTGTGNRVAQWIHQRQINGIPVLVHTFNSSSGMHISSAFSHTARVSHNFPDRGVHWIHLWQINWGSLDCPHRCQSLLTAGTHV